jgi:hypothetical protein
MVINVQGGVSILKEDDQLTVAYTGDGSVNFLDVLSITVQLVNGEMLITDMVLAPEPEPEPEPEKRLA